MDPDSFPDLTAETIGQLRAAAPAAPRRTAPAPGAARDRGWAR